MMAVQVEVLLTPLLGYLRSPCGKFSNPPSFLPASLLGPSRRAVGAERAYRALFSGTDGCPLWPEYGGDG